MKTLLWLLSAILSLQCVTAQISMVESGPGTVKPAETLDMTCKVTGASLTDSTNMYCVDWVRQPERKGLEWLGRICYNDAKAYAQSLQGRLTLTRDTNKGEVYFKLTGVKPEESGKYYCAREFSHYYFYFDIWGPGTMVTITSATQQAPSLFPLISSGTSQDSTVTIGCLAKDFLPETIDFSWNDKSNNSFTNGLLKYKPVLQSTGTYLASSQIKVTADSWNVDNPYYCVAKHSLNTKAVKLIPKIVVSPSSPEVTMHAPVKDDFSRNGNGTIVCLVNNLYPSEVDVKWFKNHVQTTLNTVTGPVRENGNGKFALSSYITVSKKEWDEDTIFSCMVIHSGISEIRNLSKSQTCEQPPVPGVIQVAVEPPSFETIFYTKKAPLTCIISNMQNTDGLEVSWHELGSGTKLEVVLDNPVFQGSSYSIKAIATVCADDWYNKKFECLVKHPDLTSPKKVILAKDKSQTPQQPTVYIFGPHKDEQNKKEGLTLTCFIKGFYPEDPFIKWSRDDQVEERNVVTTKPMEEPNSSVNKSFFMYSTLTLPSIEDWESGSMYSCTVGHEALPLQTTQRSIDKTSGKPTNVNVSLVMSDSY